jgi:hypothetical protein
LIKKTVTYKNLFTEAEVTEDLYFHLDPAELAKMWVIGGETWVEHMQTLSVTSDGKTVMEEFEKMLGTAFGERRGDKLVKTSTIREEFLSSQAYHTLFMELLAAPDNGAGFFANLVPSNIDEIVAKFNLDAKNAADDKRPAWIRENREPTKAELDKMTKAELAEAFRAKVS